jgi:DNA-directed RNA polymerase
MNVAGYYRSYRDFERGTRPEYWLEVRDNHILDYPEIELSIHYQPDPDGVGEGAGTTLVKPSHPQLKETIWNPFDLADYADVGIVTISTHVGRMPWVNNYEDVTRRDHKKREWFKAIQQLSNTAFEVNQDILDLAIKIDEESGKHLPENVEGFVGKRAALDRYRVDQEITALKEKEDLSDSEGKILQAYLDDFHDLMSRQRSVVSKRRAFDRTVTKAKNVGSRRFFNRVFSDYRGRLYFQDTGLSYQGGDLQRAIVQFPQGKVIQSSDWKFLWLHLANAWGEKGSWEERVDTATSMQSDIVRFATSPVDTYDEWSRAADKWQFIRTCFEIRTLLDHPEHPSKLIVEQDQSTSCLQHMGLLMDNAELLKKVNVGPDYSDIYQTIGNALKLKRQVSRQHRRKIVKAALVPYGYGSGVTNIANAYDELDLPYLNNLSAEERFSLAKDVLGKIEEILPAAKVYKVTMGRRATELIKQGMTKFIWDSPSGFEVHHCKQKPVPDSKAFRPIFYLGNGETARLQAIEPSNIPDTDSLRRGLPANFIHSIDSAVLHLVLVESNIPIAVVHDAYGSRVADASKVNELFYSKLLYVYDSHNPLLLFNSSIGGIEKDAEPSQNTELTPIPYPFQNNISDYSKSLIKNSQHSLT